MQNRNGHHEYKPSKTIAFKYTELRAVDVV